MKRLLPVLCLFTLSCAPGEFGAGAKMANTVLAGAACGMAAANDTPCTPRAVLDALARDAAAQKEKVQAIAPQAAAVDPDQTQLLLAEMAKNTESNAALTKALIALIEKGAAPAPSATASATPPAPTPAVTPSASVPPASTTSAPTASAAPTPPLP